MLTTSVINLITLMATIDGLDKILSELRFALSQRLCKVLLTYLFCLIALVSFPTASFAQSTAPTVETGRALFDSADVAADKVDQFAQAYLQVLKLLSDREPELPAAETNAEALKIEQSIEAEAIDLIESNGLTLPEYMQVLGLASQDATFRDKVLGRMDESLEE
ncbi:MAG: DUF4168 domain-containing protein [Phormidesmis sp.]